MTVSEAGIPIQNPFSEEKMLLLGEKCRELGFLQPADRMLDLACGHGEFLSRWAKLYGISGTGVDIVPEFVADARIRAEELGVTPRVKFIAGDANGYAVKSASYDIVSCLVAMDIGGSRAGTFALMRRFLREEKRGLLLAGEPFWNREPNAQAAAAMGAKPEDFLTLPALYDAFDRTGLTLLNMVLTDDEGWDRYQTHHWVKIHQWLRENPGDPDAAQFRAEIEDWKRSYLLYRGQFGWGVFLLGVKE
jgi:SAM-dependent methyltransferase